MVRERRRHQWLLPKSIRCRNLGSRRRCGPPGDDELRSWKNAGRTAGDSTVDAGASVTVSQNLSLPMGAEAEAAAGVARAGCRYLIESVVPLLSNSLPITVPLCRDRFQAIPVVGQEALIHSRHIDVGAVTKTLE